MKTLNLLDLFSGIGGFHYAAKLAGYDFENTYYSDIEDYANRIYAKNFPKAVAAGDVRTIDGKALREKHKGRWVITGGFPCQDISTAGKRRGLAGERSGLWFEMHRLISEVRPAAAIIENVSALASNGLDRVLISLADIGFNAEWQTISAAEAGAPHLRKRVWIVAYPTPTDSSLHGCSNLAEPNPQGRNVGNGVEPYSSLDRNAAWANWQSVLARHDKVLPKPGNIRSDDGLQKRMDEISRRVKACGNAIVPQVAATIFERLKYLLHETETDTN